MKCIECMRDIPEETVVCPYCDTNQVIEVLYHPTRFRTKWAIAGAFFAFLLAIFSWVSIYYLWAAGLLGITTLLYTCMAYKKNKEKFAKTGIFLSVISLLFVSVFLVGWILEARSIRYKAHLIGEELGIELVDKRPADRSFYYFAPDQIWEEILSYHYGETEILEMNQEVLNNNKWIQTGLTINESSYLDNFISIDMNKLLQEGSVFVVYNRITKEFSFPTSRYQYDFVLIVYQPSPTDDNHLVIYTFAKNANDLD